MDPVRQALFAALLADATLMGMLADGIDGAASIYHQIAPVRAGMPYIVVSKSSGVPTRRYGADAYATEVWLVKAVDKGPKAGNAEAIQARIETVLNDATLTINGQPSLDLHKQSDVDYPEVVGPDVYRHAGGLYRLTRV